MSIPLDIVRFLFDIIKNHYHKPKLELEGDEAATGSKVYAHVVKVRNKGRSIAKNCVGELTIDIYKNDIAHIPQNVLNANGYCIHQNNFRAIKDEGLCWSFGNNPDKIMINPRTYKKLDFYQVYIGSREIDIPSEKGFKKKRVKLKPKDYMGTITVSAENAEPVTRSFKMIVKKNDVDYEWID